MNENEELSDKTNESTTDFLDDTLDELVRVCGGLLTARVSFETVTEYLFERVEEFDPETRRRLIIWAVIRLVKYDLYGQSS